MRADDRYCTPLSSLVTYIQNRDLDFDGETISRFVILCRQIYQQGGGRMTKGIQIWKGLYL
jgi:hypothetical protein